MDVLHALFLRFFLSIIPRIPGRTIAVVRKQAPTPKKSAPPNWPNPGITENIKEPKANIVVSEVRRMAFPVLE